MQLLQIQAFDNNGTKLTTGVVKCNVLVVAAASMGK